MFQLFNYNQHIQTISGATVLITVKNQRKVAVEASSCKTSSLLYFLNLKKFQFSNLRGDYAVNTPVTNRQLNNMQHTENKDLKQDFSVL